MTKYLRISSYMTFQPLHSEFPYTVQGASGVDARFLKQIETSIKSLKITTDR
jgi:hypothetical protein